MELDKKIHIVRGILLDYPDTRDNDRLLIVKYWQHQNSDLGTLGFEFASQFLLDFTKGRYELPDTITRARRLVQARYPETRGNKYLERTTTKEQRVRADMRKEKVNTCLAHWMIL